MVGWRRGGSPPIKTGSLCLESIIGYSCLRLTLSACGCECVYAHKRCLLRDEEILDGWKESESKREHKREKRCMCMISKADIRTPIRVQCALLLLVERAGVRKR